MPTDNHVARAMGKLLLTLGTKNQPSDTGYIPGKGALSITRMAGPFNRRVRLGNTLKKVGLKAYGEPLVGMAATSLASLIPCALLFGVLSKTRSTMRLNLHMFRLFWKAGLCISVGNLLLFYAMQSGNVSDVTPLLQTEPSFILILAHFYLGKTEPFSKKLVFGAVSTVLGVILVTAF